MAKLTPMMEQYLSLKEEHPNALLLFRLGDFYELFFDDAKVAARVLSITLTGRDAGQAERVPMCGVPYHAADTYIAKLVAAGYRVAICEQMEDPSQTKGIVRREVIRVVTPGTIMDERTLPEKSARYLAAVAAGRSVLGLALCDPSTGDILVCVGDRETVGDELTRYEPAEILFVGTRDEHWIHSVTDRTASVPTVCEGRLYQRDSTVNALTSQFNVDSIDQLGLRDAVEAAHAVGSLIRYLQETQKASLDHLRRPEILMDHDVLVLDAYARRNLELLETLRDREKQGSLFGLLDETRTAMGARALRRMVERPFRSRARIDARLDAVEALVSDTFLRATLRKALDEVYDLDRLLGRVIYGSATARDLAAISASLRVLPSIESSLETLSARVFQDMRARIDVEADLCQLIDAAIVDEPPVSVREGGLIREGYDEELDHLRVVGSDNRQWIADLEQAERERTGIRSLKIGYTKVFGYYIEVSKANLSLVPSDYARRQTLTSAERFVTESLKEREALILTAHERMVAREYEIFCSLRDAVARRLASIQQTARAVAELDALQSLAEVAADRGYVRPFMTDDDRLEIKGGRHPVVETTSRTPFIANDARLDCTDRQILLITGPNMAGKSTYMRQVALIVIMAQMGSLVPAEEAKIGIVDQIFTRIGAADDLAAGQSTFMVEMVELASILEKATPQSLIILDEIGRGTSTYDGLAIAQSVIEYLHGDGLMGPRTLFATHYHELTQLASRLPRVKNCTTTIREENGTVAFLRTVTDGVADRSYGIHVARLAGLPTVVTQRAEDVLRDLEGGHQEVAPSLERFNPATEAVAERADRLAQPSVKEREGFSPATLFGRKVLEEIAATEVESMTPLDAMLRLAEWKRQLQRGGGEGWE